MADGYVFCESIRQEDLESNKPVWILRDTC